jgi:hypothetical protein
VLVDVDEAVVESPANRPSQGGMSIGVFAKSECLAMNAASTPIPSPSRSDASVEVADQPGRSMDQQVHVSQERSRARRVKPDANDSAR